MIRLAINLLAAACIAAVVLHLIAYLLFRRAGVVVAYTSAVLGGNRNVGLMLVITAGTAGEMFSLYFGLAQIPMYFAPLLLTDDADQLPARGALGRRAAAAVEAGHIEAVRGFRTAEVRGVADGRLVLVDDGGRTLEPVDEVVTVTGFRVMKASAVRFINSAGLLF